MGWNNLAEAFVRIEYGSDWENDLATKVARMDYRSQCICKSSSGRKVFAWGAGEASLEGTPDPEDFPLYVVNQQLALRFSLRSEHGEDLVRCMPLEYWPIQPTTKTLLNGLYTLRTSHSVVELCVGAPGWWRARERTPVEATVGPGSRGLRALEPGVLCRQAGRAVLLKEPGDDGEVISLRARVHPEGWVSLAQWSSRAGGELLFESAFWEPLSTKLGESGWTHFMQEPEARHLDKLRADAADACAIFERKQGDLRELAQPWPGAVSIAIDDDDDIETLKAYLKEAGADVPGSETDIRAAARRVRAVTVRDEVRDQAISRLQMYVQAAQESLVLPPKEQRPEQAACDRECQAREAESRLWDMRPPRGFDAWAECDARTALKRLTEARDASRAAKREVIEVEGQLRIARMEERDEDIAELEQTWRSKRKAAQLKDKAYQEEVYRLSRLGAHLPELLPDLLSRATEYVKKELLALEPLDQSRFLEIFATERSLEHYDAELDRMEKLSRSGARHDVHGTTHDGKRCVLKIFDLNADKANLAGFVKEVVLHRRLSPGGQPKARAGQRPGHDEQAARLVVPLRQAFLDAKPGRPVLGVLHFDRYLCDMDEWGRSHARKEEDPPGAVRELSFRMVQSVGYIHSLGIVHGDLKPSNWLFDEENKVPLLCDFETASDRGVDGHTQTRARTTAGQDLQTRGYAAPERERDPSRPKSRASDMYGLGMSIRFLADRASVQDRRLAAVADEMTVEEPSDRITAQAALIALAFVFEGSNTSADLRPPPYWVQRGSSEWHMSAFMEQQVVPQLLWRSTCTQCRPHGVATGVRISRVSRVENKILWNSYASRRNELREMAKRYGAFARHERHQLTVEDARLDEATNEVFLWHGLPGDLVDTVATSGLDDRVSSPQGLYGVGTYLTDQWCKALQYSRSGGCSVRYKKCEGRYGAKTKWRCYCQRSQKVLLCRVLLGEAYHVRPWDVLKGHRRPPEIPGSGPGRVYDSIIAKPQVGNQRKQNHWEYILFDRRSIYPEWVIELVFEGGH